MERNANYHAAHACQALVRILVLSGVEVVQYRKCAAATRAPDRDGGGNLLETGAILFDLPASDAWLKVGDPI